MEKKLYSFAVSPTEILRAIFSSELFTKKKKNRHMFSLRFAKTIVVE